MKRLGIPTLNGRPYVFAPMVGATASRAGLPGGVPRAGAGQEAHQLAGQGVWIPGPVGIGSYFTRALHAKLAKIQNGTATQAVVAYIGDSWGAQGYITTVLRSYLQQRFGDAGAGFRGINTTMPDIAGVTATRSGVWTDNYWNDGPSICDANSTDAATPGAWSVSARVDAFVIHYRRQPNGGTFRWRIDGGAWTNVNTANAASVAATETIGALTLGVHSLEIQVTVADIAGVTLHGVDCQISAAGVRLHNLALTGTTAALWRGANATRWQDAIAALGVDAFLVLLGVNDANAGHTPANYADDLLVTMRGRIRTAIPLADIIFASPSYIDLATTYPLTDYADILRRDAQTYECGFIDNLRPAGSYAASNSRGEMADATHPNAVGGRKIAGNVLAHILAPVTDHYPPPGWAVEVGTAYTLQLSNLGLGLEMNNAAANVVTVPTNALVPFPIGAEIPVYQGGAGQTSVAAAGGVTIRSRGGALNLAGQYALAMLVKRSADVWVLTGDIA